MTAGNVVDGSRERNLHEVRKAAIHTELTQGVTIGDLNPGDLAEPQQLLPLKCTLPLGRQTSELQEASTLLSMWKDCKASTFTAKSVGCQLTRYSSSKAPLPG